MIADPVYNAAAARAATECAHGCADKRACGHQCCKRHLDPPAAADPRAAAIPPAAAVPLAAAANPPPPGPISPLVSPPAAVRRLAPALDAAADPFVPATPFSPGSSHGVPQPSIFAKAVIKEIASFSLPHTPSLRELIDVLRRILRLRADGDHTLCLDALSAVFADADIQTLPPILAIRPADETTWRTACQVILAHYHDQPDALFVAENELRSLSPRASRETLDTYYARFAALLTNYTWLHSLLNPTVDTAKWQLPFVLHWVEGLDNAFQVVVKSQLSTNPTSAPAQRAYQLATDMANSATAPSPTSPAAAPTTTFRPVLNAIDTLTRRVDTFAERTRRHQRRSRSPARHRHTRGRTRSRSPGRRDRRRSRSPARPRHTRGRPRSRSPPRGPAPGAPPRPNNGLCYNCWEPGHNSSACKKPCKICTSTTHSSATCPQRKTRTPGKV
jgi:hypothetical protein